VIVTKEEVIGRVSRGVQKSKLTVKIPGIVQRLRSNGVGVLGVELLSSNRGADKVNNTVITGVAERCFVLPDILQHDVPLCRITV